MGQSDDIAGRQASRVTSYDVARRAGVSQSAVSRAFREGASISADLRDRIHRAADALGYAPSNIARALITQRSRLIGVVVTRATARNNPDILFHLGQHIQDAGSRMLVFTLPDDAVDDSILSDLLSYHVDGVITAASIAEDTLRRCAQRGLPVILYNRHGIAASVSCDRAHRNTGCGLHRRAAGRAGQRGAPPRRARRLRRVWHAFAPRHPRRLHA